MNSLPTDRKTLLLIPILTLSFGFIPFCLLSIYYDVFWIDTKYDVPLVYNISVMLGDSLLLPFINYLIFKIILIDITFKQLLVKKAAILRWISVSLFLSIVINYSAHLTWKNDFYSDFISIDGLTFLPSGCWHLIFSILEMTILFLFPLLWYITIRSKNINGIKHSTKIWAFLFLFSILASFDMLMKFFFVYELTFTETLKTDYFAFITPSLCIILLIIMSTIKSRHSQIN